MATHESNTISVQYAVDTLHGQGSLMSCAPHDTDTMPQASFCNCWNVVNFLWLNGQQRSFALYANGVAMLNTTNCCMWVSIVDLHTVPVIGHCRGCTAARLYKGYRLQGIAASCLISIRPHTRVFVRHCSGRATVCRSWSCGSPVKTYHTCRRRHLWIILRKGDLRRSEGRAGCDPFTR